MAGSKWDSDEAILTRREKRVSKRKKCRNFE